MSVLTRRAHGMNADPVAIPRRSCAISPEYCRGGGGLEGAVVILAITIVLRLALAATEGSTTIKAAQQRHCQFCNSAQADSE
ncbi:hypothetical protein BDU57DRAFT_524369 [Ampelomyces quisqualis]|uniref:Uncharacterized protein n=1 Tax=Ampelomyces quisqualis TaxID=50730 RepID=A0A6A5Q603_AMPQU|nr:hypothetical protein BDU57DRAFT_524369 [Ampelomyces quisqualis]